MEKATVFVVNSLSNGGAERVVSVMANYMKKNAFVITFDDTITYPVDPSVQVICLNSKKMGKIKKYLKLPFLIHRFHKVYRKIKKEYEIELATSHLVYSHLLCRLSHFRNEFIYVIHNPYYPFDPKQSFWYRKKIQFLYQKRKLCTVSKGVEEELKNRYRITTPYLKTIYNPIDFKTIREKMNEEVDVENYLLFCGRFNEAKRPDHAIELFYKQNLYQKYQLVMIGTGELEQLVRLKIAQYHLEDRVILKGWTNNPYAYMRHALLMFNCSHFEAFPMTLIEALACSCKVVSYDIEYGPKELLTGEFSKYLVPFDDMAMMGIVMEKTIREDLPNLEDHLKPYQIDAIVDSYKKTYQEWC